MERPSFRIHKVLNHLAPSSKCPFAHSNDSVEANGTSSSSPPTSFTPPICPPSHLLGIPPSIPPSLVQTLPGPWEMCETKRGHGRIVLPYMAEGKSHLMMKYFTGKYGPVYGLMLYEPPTKTLSLRVTVSDPEEARRILKLNPPKPAGYSTSVILGEGVLSNQDPVEWARQRDLLKRVFTNPAMKELMPVLMAGINTLLSTFRSYSSSNTPFDIHEELSDYTFLMIGISALGEADEFLTKKAKPLREAFTVAALSEVQRKSVEKHEDYFNARNEINGFTDETLARYEERIRAGCPARKDSLISVVTSRDERGCPHMNPKQRADELSTFMFAGHETTAHTMSWAILELARHPEYQRKLQLELDSKLAELGGFEKLEFKDLFKFEYLTLLINETLRCWPVVANGTFRRMQEDTVIRGITIPKDTIVNFPHYIIHRDKKVWGEDADQFIPERKWFPDSFIPFTVSPRDCLGRNLAMMEMRIVLISLFYHFNVALDDPSLHYEGYNTFTLLPEHGVWVRLQNRR